MHTARTALVIALLAGLASCGQQQQPRETANEAQPIDSRAPTASPDNETAPVAAEPATAAKTPRVLEEPTGPIDPKSVEAAGQVVQKYFALIEQKSWTRSRTYWSDPASAKAFERSFRDDADVHGEIGELGEPEGAAGSIYVTEPVTFYGKTNAGGDYRRRADVILRRVNDVPGSTESQRRWHIERIEWKKPA